MSNSRDKSEAVKRFLAPGESVESAFHEPRESVSQPNYYALTDRRLIELTERQTDDDEREIAFRSHPLERATGISVKRIEDDGGEMDEEMIAAALISGFAGLVAAILPVPGSFGELIFGIGILLVVVGLIFAVIGLDGSSGGRNQIRLWVGQPESSTSITMPIEGEGFAQNVAAQIGRHQG